MPTIKNKIGTIKIITIGLQFRKKKSKRNKWNRINDLHEWHETFISNPTLRLEKQSNTINLNCKLTLKTFHNHKY